MGMIDQQRNSSSVGCGRGSIWAGVDPTVLSDFTLYSIFVDVEVEFYQKEGLVLYVRKEVVFSDEIEDAGTTKFQEVRQSFARLTVEDESGGERNSARFDRNRETHALTIQRCFPSTLPILDPAQVGLE